MPGWQNDPETRRQTDAFYSDPEYKKNRPLAWRRAGGRCEQIIDGKRCSRRDRCQVDHIINRLSGGTHHLDNLRVLCLYHHRIKTAQEGKGYRGGRKPKADPVLQVRTQW